MRRRIVKDGNVVMEGVHHVKSGLRKAGVKFANEAQLGPQTRRYSISKVGGVVNCDFKLDALRNYVETVEKDLGVVWTR